MLKMNEINNWDEKAIQGKIEALKNDVFNLRMQKITSGLEKPHMLKDSKKDIARLNTVLNQKKREK